MPLLEAPPLSLYIHFPWCVKKCPYCDFNSHTLKTELPERAYVDALLADLELDDDPAGPRSLVSIFLGGGTPSLFAPASLDRLITVICKRFDCTEDLEVTLEANPGTLERGRFAEYLDAGINRISLGVQSFDDDKLKVLGRIHTARESIRALEEAHQAGVERLNIDLMYALPGQSVAQAVTDLDTALRFAPEHVSHYQLTIEPDTFFYKHPPALPTDESALRMLEACAERFTQAGLEQYEVSAWSRPHQHGRHNLNYWEYGDYLGVGSGAHGKLTDPVNDRIVRTIKRHRPATYLRMARTASRIWSITEVARSERAFEFMLNALRLRKGFGVTAFEARTGVTIGAIADQLAAAEAKGLLEHVQRSWRATGPGFRFLNDLQAMFLPDAENEGQGFMTRVSDRREPQKPFQLLDNSVSG